MKNIKNWIWRLVYLAGLGAFFLPFVSVKGCKTKVITVYRGTELIKQENGWLIIIPIAALIIFLAFSFYKKQIGLIFKGFLKSGKAFVSLVSFYIVLFAPGFMFMISTVKPKMGQYISAACFGIISLINFIGVLILWKKVKNDTASYIPGKMFSLRIVFNNLLAVSLIAGVGLLFWKNRQLPQAASWVNVSIFVTVLFVLCILYFVDRGLKRNQLWSLVWLMLISTCFLVAILIAVVILVSKNKIAILGLLCPLYLLISAVFIDALQYFLNYRRMRSLGVF